jgi:glycosyltransferase involved in cell wall biosynthesis
MRIVLYHPRAAIGDGGMSRAIRKLANAMAERGANVTLAFAAGSAPPSANGVRWEPIRHSGARGVTIPIELDKVLRGADLIVLHSAWVVHNVRVAAAARRASIPYVLSPRGAYDPSIFRRKQFLKRVWWLSLERELLAKARGVHVFFESERQNIESLGYRGPLLVARNGVESPPGVQWDGGTGGYLLWIGRFDPEHKGLDLLVDSMRLLRASERPPLSLHGPDWRGGKQRLIRRIKELGLEQWVSVGDAVYREEKWDLLRRARAFVYPSRWEAFGNSVAEAISIGVPSLVTPYPLGSYLATRGGAFIADASAAELAAGIATILSVDTATVGETGAAIVRRDFSWDSVARVWLDGLRGFL